MSFKQFLAENSNKIEIVQKTIEMLNIAVPKRSKQLMIAQDLIVNAIKNDTIYNVQYKDSYDYVGRAYEEMLSEIQNREYYPALRDISDHVRYNLPDVSTYSPIPGSNLSLKKINAYLKTYAHNSEHQKFVSYFTNIKNVIEKMIPLIEILKELKTKIQKGRVPNPNAVPKFEPKFTQTEAKIILDKFKELTSEIRSKQIMQLEKQYHDLVNDYINQIKDIPITGRSGISKRSVYQIYRDDNQKKIPLQSLITSTDYKDDYRPIDNLNGKITMMATRNIDDFHMQFISKNVQKLSGVIARKDNLKEIRTISLQSNAYTLSAELYFIFDDKARFAVINKAVYGYSKSNTPFVRFPTMFHDVILSDGTKMKSPNEEKMNKEFQ